MKAILSQLRQFVLARSFVGILITGAMLSAFSTSAFALWPAGVYRFDAITGTVLDKETRKPIEGVVVVGHWGLETNQIMSSSYSGPLVVKEVMTDKDGKFTIPASVATDIHKRGHFNAEMYPEIAFFKGGYDFTVYRHNGKRPISRFPEPYNTLNEDEYLMPEWLQDSKAQINKLENMFLSFALTNTAGTCTDFETVAPRLLSALRSERDRIAKENAQLSRLFANSYSLFAMEGCILENKRKGKSS